MWNVNCELYSRAREIPSLFAASTPACLLVKATAACPRSVCCGSCVMPPKIDTKAHDADTVLAGVKRLQRETEVDVAKRRRTPSDLGYANVYEVADMQAGAVAQKVETLALVCINSILSGRGLQYVMPSRTGNSKYIAELDANFLEYKEMKRAFEDQGQVRWVVFDGVRRTHAAAERSPS